MVLFLQLAQQTVVFWRGEGVLFDRELFFKFTHQPDDFLADAVSEFDRGQHIVFWNFPSKTFDHGDHRISAGNDDIHVRLFQLLMCWERNEFTINSSDAR